MIKLYSKINCGLGPSYKRKYQNSIIRSMIMHNSGTSHKITDSSLRLISNSITYDVSA